MVSTVNYLLDTIETPINKRRRLWAYFSEHKIFRRNKQSNATVFKVSTAVWEFRETRQTVSSNKHNEASIHGRMRVWVWIQRQESPTSLTAMIKEQCITVSSRLSRQIKDYSSARNRAGFSAGRAKFPWSLLILAPVFITIYSRAYYDGFVITYRNQADRPLYALRNSPCNAALLNARHVNSHT